MSFGSFVGEAMCQSGILFHLYQRICYNHLVSQSYLIICELWFVTKGLVC